MIKQPTKKRTVFKAKVESLEGLEEEYKKLDLQTPPEQIDKAPQTAMQEKPPFITQEIEVVQETAPKPDPDFIPRIPNGDPFDTMYRRQRKM